MVSRYLQACIDRQATGLIAPLTALKVFNPLIYEWAGNHALSATLSGSHAKGTAVKCCADIDIFISLSPTLNMNLSDIYDNLYNFFYVRGFNPRKQNVSIRANHIHGTVDLVPGRKQDYVSNYHSLYVNKRQTWTQTNIDTHIAAVTQSGKTNLIKLVKIWRERQQLEFPSLYLELAVIRSTQNYFSFDLTSEFKYTMTWFYNNIQTAHFVDPSNTNNILSDDLTMSEKATIKTRAGFAAVTNDFSKVVW